MQCVAACQSLERTPKETALMAHVEAKIYMQALQMQKWDDCKYQLFPSVQSPPIVDDNYASSITTFEAARNWFKKAMAALNTAKVYSWRRSMRDFLLFDIYIYIYIYKYFKISISRPIHSNMWIHRNFLSWMATSQNIFEFCKAKVGVMHD
jgi:hypothetical protein